MFICHRMAPKTLLLGAVRIQCRCSMARELSNWAHGRMMTEYMGLEFRVTGLGFEV